MYEIHVVTAETPMFTMETNNSGPGLKIRIAGFQKRLADLFLLLETLQRHTELTNLPPFQILQSSNSCSASIRTNPQWHTTAFRTASLQKITAKHTRIFRTNSSRMMN